jgi:hypothetical protein
MNCSSEEVILFSSDKRFGSDDTGLEGTGKEYKNSREGNFSSADFPTVHWAPFRGLRIVHITVTMLG